MKQNDFRWRVPELDPADPGAGASTARLFEGRRDLPIHILVREDLQNRVDARAPGTQTAKVRISRYELPQKLIARYFPEQFQQDLKATEVIDMEPDRAARRQAELDQLFARPTFPVLVIEDFGTTGLNGPVNSRMPEKNPELPLYHPTNALTCFLRRNGRSGKTKYNLGSAGLGRHVYYKASEISAKLVFTVPADLYWDRNDHLEPIEPRSLFFGQSYQRELESRTSDGKQRFCSAYHHLTSEMPGDDSGGFPLPFGVRDEEADLVESVRKELRLHRKPTQPGLSIVIPFPKAHLTRDNFVRAIVREFAMPILLGQLQVDVDDVAIRADTVADLSDDEAVNETNRFLAAALRTDSSTEVTVPVDALAAPVSAGLFDKERLPALALSWRNRDMVRVDFRVEYGERPDQRGVARVAVQRCVSSAKGRGVVTRGGLPLSRYSDSKNARPWNGCTMLGTDKLSAVLRGSETASHDKWIPGDIDAADCACAEDLVRFVSTAHQGLARLLEGLDTEDDVSIFADVLPGRGGRRVVDSTPKQSSPFEVSLEDDGQTLRLVTNDDYDAPAGTRWNLVVVYDSILGAARARKSFRSSEFDLASAECRVSGGTAKPASGCSLSVSVADPDEFILRVGPCGFSDWADIRVLAEREDAR
jgi:hypothetical protein